MSLLYTRAGISAPKRPPEPRANQPLSARRRLPRDGHAASLAGSCCAVPGGAAQGLPGTGRWVRGCVVSMYLTRGEMGALLVAVVAGRSGSPERASLREGASACGCGCL
ncbi:uncharacterized protein K452DRAFT_159003 [Aplosporella prunicola CBS 121167]|uniref:Uncharacterized protein n=1 Tax=Aplosporella prunicola CBS 121167 TaxID=1176127 RepID=A0A6A6AX95_9PEZI|nr:uncharacterized protein K452DRAFT_159003 [Aplosporella prunicola CBS 121167]KAF2135803.1 hypothetical protein K452DRAFT_159003 [Aplosporella prunicola CBS 121167]